MFDHANYKAIKNITNTLIEQTFKRSHHLFDGFSFILKER